MSKLIVSLDYIAMSQWISYGRHVLKKKDGESSESYEKRVIDELNNCFAKMIKLLDDGVDRDILKYIKNT